MNTFPNTEKRVENTMHQGSKLTLANSQNVSGFNNPFRFSQAFGKSLLEEKILPAKLCKGTEKLASSPAGRGVFLMNFEVFGSVVKHIL